MNELQVFNNPEFGEVRCIEIEGEPWFVGKDVAQALGYSDTKSAVADHVDEDDKKIVKRGQFATFDIPNRGLVIINESGLYSLVLSSKLSSARKFKHWITHEVIPSLRKTGGYIMGQEQMSDAELLSKALDVAHRVLAERDKRIKAQSEYINAQKGYIDEQEQHIAELSVTNQIMQPKADYFDELVSRNLLTGFRETAKQLGVPPRKFVQFLLDHKYLYRDKRGKLLPKEDKNDGLFEVKECYNEKTKWSGTQTLVTPKGRETFRLLFID